jgi:pyruvate,water dikinase
MRLEVLRLRRALEEASRGAAACGVETAVPATEADGGVDLQARIRLAEIRDGTYWAVQVAGSAPGLDPRLRHSLRTLERLDRVLGNPVSDLGRQSRTRLDGEDASALRRAEGRRVLTQVDGGFELHPLIGWKAANLAEVGRLGGPDLVPAWVVVTDLAFREVLDAPPKRWTTAGSGSPAGEPTLRAAIDAVLGRSDLDDVQKSALIRGLWETVELPEAIAREVLEAYARLGQDAPADAGPEEDRAHPFVAIRSSAREEDAEAAARAGEFETFLFIRGEQPLLDHLKRAWSGLWTERAIHNRAVMGAASGTAGGGVIVQRIAWSRVSGVLQTVNVAEGETGEMVLNAGLGLGEGIVSGTVGADHVVVSREGDLEEGPLRFRYITGDKEEKVVFNRRDGLGTVRVECLYHQRLRPALEYVELSELVRTAGRLEAAYGYPLDIEFGIEGARLRILQVRPVATTLSVLGETLERYPLSGARARAS